MCYIHLKSYYIYCMKDTEERLNSKCLGLKGTVNVFLSSHQLQAKCLTVGERSSVKNKPSIQTQAGRINVYPLPLDTSHFKTYSAEIAIKVISLRVAAEITGLQRILNSLEPQKKKNKKTIPPCCGI